MNEILLQMSHAYKFGDETAIWAHSYLQVLKPILGSSLTLVQTLVIF
jgi:hypothetical protein